MTGYTANEDKTQRGGFDPSEFGPRVSNIEPYDIPMIRAEIKTYPVLEWSKPYSGPNGQIYKWRMPNGTWHICGVTKAFEDEEACIWHIKHYIPTNSHHSLH